jgi:hypothetical protein
MFFCRDYTHPSAGVALDSVENLVIETRRQDANMAKIRQVMCNEFLQAPLWAPFWLPYQKKAILSLQAVFREGRSSDGVISEARVVTSVGLNRRNPPFELRGGHAFHGRRGEGTWGS